MTIRLGAIGAGLTELVERWRKTIGGQHLVFAVDQTAVFKLFEDVDEVATGEATKQQPAVITIRN